MRMATAIWAAPAAVACVEAFPFEGASLSLAGIWVVVKMMILFWVLVKYIGDPKGDYNFDNHLWGSLEVPERNSW